MVLLLITFQNFLFSRFSNRKLVPGALSLDKKTFGAPQSRSSTVSLILFYLPFKYLSVLSTLPPLLLSCCVILSGALCSLKKENYGKLYIIREAVKKSSNIHFKCGYFYAVLKPEQQKESNQISYKTRKAGRGEGEKIIKSLIKKKSLLGDGRTGSSCHLELSSKLRLVFGKSEVFCGVVLQDRGRVFHE